MAELTDREVQDCISSLLRSVKLMQHHLASYDYFVSSMLPHIILENARASYESLGLLHSIYYTKPRVLRPTMVVNDEERWMPPFLSRLRCSGFSYMSTIVVDVVHEARDRDELVWRKTYSSTCIGRIPCMVKSKLCHTYASRDFRFEEKSDEGGYFIVNGIEKVLVSNECLCRNTIYVFPGKSNSRYEVYAEVRSCHEAKLRSTSTLLIKVGQRHSEAQLPFISSGVPVHFLFVLLGVRSREEALSLVLNEEADDVRHTATLLFEASEQTGSYDLAEAVEWIGRRGTQESTREKRANAVNHVVAKEIVPHVSLFAEAADLRRKAVFVAAMLRRALLCLCCRDSHPLDDRDDMRVKRVETTGMQMSLLFRQLYRSSTRSFHVQLRNLAENGTLSDTNVANLVSSKKISMGFKYAFSTGNWGTQRGSPGQTGVVQPVNKISRIAVIAAGRRTSTPSNKEQKTVKPRLLHDTTYGLLCPAETPEGACIGLVKNLAIGAHVRIGMRCEKLIGVLRRRVASIAFFGEDTFVPPPGEAVVDANGVFVGSVPPGRVQETLCLLRQLRRQALIPFDTSVFLCNGAVCVRSDYGCLLRPLFVVSRLHRVRPVLQTSCRRTAWRALLREGAVEYLDKHEETQCSVCQSLNELGGSKAYTHCEIHPCLILGVCASVVPFLNHSPSPRNVYQGAMCKQAMAGMSLTAADHTRFDALGYWLCYPQRPLVTTQVAQMLDCVTANGANPIVCIMCYGGKNQEDSLIVNEGALQRGMFSCICSKTVRDEESNGSGGDVESFGTADAETLGKAASSSYDKLDEHGIARLGEEVGKDDVVIGKMMVGVDLRRRGGTVKRDRSTVYRCNEACNDAPRCAVKAICMTQSNTGRSVKLRLEEYRQTLIGDKFSSLHGQKGIVGAVYPHSRMPFTADGIVPDLIINPHAIPSRMTIGQLLEALLGKLAAATGRVADGSPFRSVTAEQIGEELTRAGHQGKGEEVMYCGFTGRRLRDRVFLAPTHYQRLKHLVLNKIHARSTGPKLLLTRQPNEGRFQNGGLRFGEMERDCALSHGAASFLRDRLFHQSDYFEAPFCSSCGLLARSDRKSIFCSSCGGDAKMVPVPYAFKLFVQECYSLNLAIRLKLTTV